MKRRRRVLYLSPTSAWGGAEAFLEQTARLHNRDAFEPVYLFFSPGPLVERISKTGAVCHVLSPSPRLSRPRSMFRTIAKIRQIAKREKIELIHSNMAYAALFGAIASKLAGLPHTWFQHGPATSWIDRVAGLLPSSAILVNSRFTEEKQRRLKARGPIRLVHLGVDPFESKIPDIRHVLRGRYGIGENEKVFALLCRVQPQKGLEIFIEAIAMLESASLSSGRAPVRGIVVGEALNPEYRGYFEDQKKLAARLGAPVLFVGYSDRPADWVQASDGIVCSSVHPEGFGLTLVEGMAAGKLVAAPREGGPAEIISDGEDGILYQPRSSKDLFLRLYDVLESRGEYEKLCERATQNAKEKYSACGMIRELERFYGELL